MISFEFIFVSRCPLGLCQFIFIPQKLCRSVPFAIRYYHSNHIGIALKESTSRLYPILLVGEQIDQNISLQREMVQECVKRQGAQDGEREKGGRGGRRIREMLKQGWCKRMREKRRGRSMEESSGWGGGVLHTKTDKEYQEAARYTRKRAEIIERGAG